MKKIILPLLFLVAQFSFAQTAQKGLLWKISKEGQKPSYIYGNMHVSEKIAFHLGEEFFNAISSVDKIALESNPIVWLDEIMNSELASDYIGRYALASRVNKGFYKNNFKINIPQNSDYSAALSQDHYFMNWLLYRENKSRSDFSEETFLDMFIYQSGAKNNKEVLSLENFKATTKYARLSSMPDIDRKERAQWYKKLTKEKSYNEVMQEAYRMQDLSLIDSISREVSSNTSQYWMIVKRNQIMASNIDSILSSGTSLFAGVGAAHLGGKDGIINMLMDKGYTLTPMPVTFNDKARDLRESYDKKKIPLKNYHLFKSELFSVETPVKIYETPYTNNQRLFFGPELTNGSHFTIRQISTYSMLNGLSLDDYVSKIDSLLFENIPGKIQSKKVKKTKDFYELDILNKTKEGDYQRYKLYINPVHFFIFKMGGKDDFVKNESDRFFNSIKIKTPNNKWVNASDSHHNFSIQVPEYYSINNNKKVTALYGEPVLEAYNNADSSYYYLNQVTMYDWSFIETDTFELKRIAEKFFLSIKLDTVEAHMLKNQSYPTAIAYGRTNDSSYLAVKVIVKGPKFYVLAAKTNTYKETNRFFDSFKLTDPKYLFPFETKIDSSTFIKVHSNYVQPQAIEYTINQAYKRRNEKNKTEDKSYQQKIQTTYFYSENFEKVQVKTIKFHDFKSYENIDSLWSFEIKKIAENDNTSNYLIVKSKKASVHNGMNELLVNFSDTASSRIIKTKYLLKHGYLYRLKTVLDSNQKESKFIREFYSSFQPLDTVMGRSPFENKAALFFKYIYGDDSLSRVNAFKSVSRIPFKTTDIDSIKSCIENYKFPDKHLNVKKVLISKLVSIKGYNDYSYIENLYKNAGDTAMYQMEILNSLARRGDEKSVKLYLKLLDFDVPISGEKWNNSYIFYPYKYSVKNKNAAGKIVTPLLNYTFIEKYRSSIIDLLAYKVDSNQIKVSAYKKKVAQLLREAKILMKEEISYEQNQIAKQGNYSSYSYYSNRSNYKYKDNEKLLNYVISLRPYYKNKKVKAFIDKFYGIQNLKLKSQVMVALQKNNITVDTSVWSSLAKDPINAGILYKLMQDNDLLEYFPKAYLDQEYIVRALLFETGHDFEKDSIEFIEKRYVNNGKDSGYVYFYKTKRQGRDTWTMSWGGYQPKDQTKINGKLKLKNKRNSFDKTKDMKEILDEKMEILRLKHHPHASGSERSGYGGYY